MRIFNLRLICKDETPTKGVKELNTYSLGDAANNGIGLVYGVEFFVSLDLTEYDLAPKTFYLIQCENEAKIYFVPEDAKGIDDYTLVFSHSTYDDIFDIMYKFIPNYECEILKNLWLYSVDGCIRFNTNKCLGVE